MKYIFEDNTLHGLRPLPKDERDFSVGQVFNLPDPKTLPEEFTVGLPVVVQQDITDFCAAASSCAVSELQEGVPLGFEWEFAVAKWLSGDDVDSFGLDLRVVCKAHVKYGAIERSQSPYSLENKDASFLRRIENWPEDLFGLALKHRKGSFFAVTGPYDNYDNIRATMYYFKDEKCGVLFGVLWGWAISQVVIDTIPTQGSGHAMAQIGWDKQGMYVQNSIGLTAGNNGRHYFTRDVVNKFVDIYGAFMFHDMPKEQAQWHAENKIKVTDCWPVQFLKILLNLLHLR